jgi:hypothetical protein
MGIEKENLLPMPAESLIAGKNCYVAGIYERKSKLYPRNRRLR